MGLDNYIIVEDEKLYPKINEELEGLTLVRGWLGAGHWIRGKVYNELIEACTGISLYTKVIPPEKVRIMSLVLQKYKFSKVKRYMGWWEKEDQEEAWESIQKYFLVAAKYNAGLGGWW